MYLLEILRIEMPWFCIFFLRAISVGLLITLMGRVLDAP